MTPLAETLASEEGLCSVELRTLFVCYWVHNVYLKNYIRKNKTFKVHVMCFYLQ
jgi:hypothetical protein